MLQLFLGLVSTDPHGQKLLHLPALKPILDICIMTRGQFDTAFTFRSQRVGLKIAELPVPIVEVRKQRNWMLKKIVQNSVDIVRLEKLLNLVPANGVIHYHRYSRQKMEPSLATRNYETEVNCFNSSAVLILSKSKILTNFWIVDSCNSKY